MPFTSSRAPLGSLLRLAFLVLLLFAVTWAARAGEEHFVQVTAAESFKFAAGILGIQGDKSPDIREAAAQGFVRISLYKDPRGEWWRVLVGPFPSRERAVDFCARVKLSDVDCLVR